MGKPYAMVAASVWPTAASSPLSSRRRRASCAPEGANRLGIRWFWREGVMAGDWPSRLVEWNEIRIDQNGRTVRFVTDCGIFQGPWGTLKSTPAH